MEKELELLAPVGKMDVLESVLQAGADAVYLGGKLYNMRMLRPDYNFSRDELKKAVDIVHRQNKKIHITVNNMYTNRELEGLSDYLSFLQSIGVDALIVQDLGVAELHRQLGLTVHLHASVQMGMVNAEAVNLLEENRFSRIILSRNVNLEEIKHIHEHSSLEIESFAHGELCISHAGQCHLSSLLSGESGNRGLCRKPCRWQYQLQGNKNEKYNGFQYFLAMHDLCLYPYLPQMIEAGVISFKIEGRMRDAAFLSQLISTYRQALDRYIENPDSWKSDEKECRQLDELRVRDYCTGHIFERPGEESVGFDGQREPQWPMKEQPLPVTSQNEILWNEDKAFNQIPEISVRVGSLESVEAACRAGADYVVIGMDSWRQNHFTWTQDKIREAVQLANSENCKVLAETPRIVTESELPGIQEMRQFAEDSDIAGFVVNDLGSLRILRSSGKQIRAGVGLNVANQYAAAFLKRNGVDTVTVSIECSVEEMQGFIDQTPDLELLVQGPMIGMICDYCIPRSVCGLQRDECGKQCLRDDYALFDRLGQKFPIRTDEKCRNYVLYPFHRSLIKRLPQIMEWGINSVRIEGQDASADQVFHLVKLYREAMSELFQGKWNGQDALLNIINMFPEGMSEGPLF